MELALDVRAWTTAYEDFLANPGPWDFLADWARAWTCLPVYVDWTHALGVRSTGSVVAYEHEPWPLPIEMNNLLPVTPCVVEHPRLINLALYQGARRYLWLLAVVPQRPADAQVCSSCDGTGQLPVDVICYCGGAGWVPADDTWVNHERLTKTPLK
jgi:hypothetical protein